MLPLRIAGCHLLATTKRLQSQFHTLVLSSALSKYENKDTKLQLKSEGHEEDSSSTPMIMLLGHNNSRIGLMSFKEAQHMAKQKDLKLVQIEDPTISKRFRHEVYKLLTGVQLQEERLKAKTEKQTSSDDVMNLSKGEKVLIMGGKITEHDLKTRTKTIQKWLRKGLVIRVTINGDRNTVDNLDQIYSEMEKVADEVGGQALQKRRHGEEGHSLKFTLQLSRKKLDAMKNKEKTTKDNENERDTEQ